MINKENLNNALNNEDVEMYLYEYSNCLFENEINKQLCYSFNQGSDSILNELSTERLSADLDKSYSQLIESCNRLCNKLKELFVISHVPGDDGTLIWIAEHLSERLMPEQYII